MITVTCDACGQDIPVPLSAADLDRIADGAPDGTDLADVWLHTWAHPEEGSP